MVNHPSAPNSIIGYFILCKQCGEVRKYPMSHILKRGPNFFCCKSCCYKFRKGKIPWNKQEKIKVKCHQCSIEFESRPNEVERSENRFCSAKCYHKWKKENKIGNFSAKLLSGINHLELQPWTPCCNCGDIFKISTTLLNRATSGVFCCKECSLEYQKKNAKYIKGIRDEIANELYLWARRVRRRDKVCQICGNNDCLQAHHIKSFMDYPEYRLDLNNGITLCRKHHNWVTNFNTSAQQ